MSIKVSLFKKKDRATATTSGRTAVDSKVGGTKINSTVSAFILVLKQQVQSSDYGRWVNE